MSLTPSSVTRWCITGVFLKLIQAAGFVVERDPHPVGVDARALRPLDESMEECRPGQGEEFPHPKSCTEGGDLNRDSGSPFDTDVNVEPPAAVPTCACTQQATEETSDEPSGEKRDVRVTIVEPGDGSLRLGPKIPLLVGLSIAGGGVADWESSRDQHDGVTPGLSVCVGIEVDDGARKTGSDMDGSLTSRDCFEVELESNDPDEPVVSTGWLKERYAEVVLSSGGHGWHTVHVTVHETTSWGWGGQRAEASSVGVNGTPTGAIHHRMGAQVASTFSRLFVASAMECEWKCHHFPQIKETSCIVMETSMGDNLKKEDPKKRYVGLDWTLGGGFGWGTAGINIALEIESMTLEAELEGGNNGTYIVPLREVHAHGLSKEKASRLEASLIRGAALQENLPHWQGGLPASASARGSVGESRFQNLIRLPFPVVHCLGRWGPGNAVDTSSLSLSGGGVGFWGTANVGLIFFESEEPFLDDDLAQLSRFDGILAGSRWNGKLLQEALSRWQAQQSGDGIKRRRKRPSATPKTPVLGTFLQGVDGKTFYWDPQANLASRKARRALISHFGGPREAGGVGIASTPNGSKLQEEKGGNCPGEGKHAGDDAPTRGHTVPGSRGADNEENPEAEHFWVFSGGKLEYRKGQDIVVEAFKRFRLSRPHSRAHLVTAWQNDWPASLATIERSPHTIGAPAYRQGQGQAQSQRQGQHCPSDHSTNMPDLPCEPPPWNFGSFPSLDVRRWLELNGLPPEVVVDLGRVPHEEMPGALRATDVAVFVSRCEGGTNLAAMEAIAVGVPTVISANTGHLDLIERASASATGCYPTGNRTFTAGGGGGGAARDEQQSWGGGSDRGNRSEGTDAGEEWVAGGVGTMATLDAATGAYYIGQEPGAVDDALGQGCGETSVDEVVEQLERVFDEREDAMKIGEAGAKSMRLWRWRDSVVGLMGVLDNAARVNN